MSQSTILVDSDAFLIGSAGSNGDWIGVSRLECNARVIMIDALLIAGKLAILTIEFENVIW